MTSKGPGVLYVDDDPNNLFVFEATFRDVFPVVTCASPRKAIEIIASGEPEIGVILSDQRMREMPGIALLQKARELAPEVQRMVITAYADAQVAVDAINRGGVSRFLEKPWERATIEPALLEALSRYEASARARAFALRLLCDDLRADDSCDLFQVAALVRSTLPPRVRVTVSGESARVRGAPRIVARVLAALLKRGSPETIALHWTREDARVELRVENVAAIPDHEADALRALMREIHGTFAADPEALRLSFARAD